MFKIQVLKLFEYMHMVYSQFLCILRTFSFCCTYTFSWHTTHFWN